MSRTTVRTSVAGALAAAMALLGACNPQAVGLDRSVAPHTGFQATAPAAHRYGGPPEAWLEIEVLGAAGLVVHAMASVDEPSRTGPYDRWCAGPGELPVRSCNGNVGSTGPYMPWPVRLAPVGQSPTRARLMTVWSGEASWVHVRCFDPATDTVGCPPEVRVALLARDWDGNLVGNLEPTEAGSPVVQPGSIWPFDPPYPAP